MSRKVWVATGMLGALGTAGIVGIGTSHASDVENPELAIFIPADTSGGESSEKLSADASTTPSDGIDHPNPAENSTKPSTVSAPGAVPVTSGDSAQSATTTVSAISAYSAD